MPELTRTRRRGFLTGLLGLTVLTLGAGVFSLAIFTDTASSNGSFATGTIDISSSPTVAFTVTNMLPGDSDTQALTIDNDGSAEFRYAMTTTATNALGSALVLEVREEGTDCATFDGVSVMLPTALDVAGFGDNAPGDDSGDRYLLASGSEVLCFRVSLPQATNDQLLQGATSDAEFIFDAEQVANNP